MSAKSGSFVLQDLQSRLENVQDLNVEDIRRLVNGLSRISAKNQRSVSFMRLVLSRLTSMINLQTNLVSILSDIRLMLLVTAFAGPSTSYSVLSRVSKSLNRDIKQYMAYQIPYYIATLRPPTIDSVNRHGVVTLIDLKNSQLREEIEHYNMEQSKFELDYMLEYSDGEEMKHSFKSEIEHGILLESGERILSKYSAELDENIDVFMAVNDVQRRELYPLSHLASQLNFSAESIAIFIARNEELRDEIYQATGYQHIPDTPVTRKSGECFISFKVELIITFVFVISNTDSCVFLYRPGSTYWIIKGL